MGSKGAGFWLEKLVLLALIFVLLGFGWYLWDYDTEDEVAETPQTTAQVNTLNPTPAAEPTTTPAETPTPTETTTESEEAVFPFSLDDKNTAADFPGIDEDFQNFTYTFAPNGQIEVGRQGIANIDASSRDFEWTYTLDANGKLVLASNEIVFCPSAAPCGTGNGVMEVLVTPADGGDGPVFYITDTGEVTEFTAVDKYTPLLQSYQEVQG